MKILIHDKDPTHNKKLEHAFSGSDVKAVFCDTLPEILEILNGYPQLDAKKKEMEKAVADATADATKATAGLEPLTKALAEKRTQLLKIESDKAQEEAKKALEVEIRKIEGQVDQATKLKDKMVATVETRKKELSDLQDKIPKEGERKVGLFIVDRNILGQKPLEWVNEFRNGIQLKDNKTIPIVVMGHSDLPAYIMGSLVPGIDDYFVKPVDLLLLRHNVARLSGKSMESDEKVFELQTQAEIKLLKRARVLKLSEFEMEVSSPAEFAVGELVDFIADIFNFAQGGKLLGKCVKCMPDPATKGLFIVQFSFVGLASHTMNELRKWLKVQYVNSKQKE